MYFSYLHRILKMKLFESSSISNFRNAALKFMCLRWFPTNERATAVGISMGGFQLGNVVGLILTPPAISSIGIAGPFVLFTFLGFLWLIAWMYRVVNDPQESTSISKPELKLIQAGKSDPCVNKGKLPPLSLLFSKLPTWAIILANIANNWVRFLFLFSSCIHGTFSLPSGYRKKPDSCFPCRATSFFYHGCQFISILWVCLRNSPFLFFFSSFIYKQWDYRERKKMYLDLNFMYRTNSNKLNTPECWYIIVMFVKKKVCLLVMC